MKRCEECGKKLGIIEGYCHPILGKKFLICSKCFDIEYGSKVKWREAHLPYVGFFNNNSIKKKYQLNMKNKFTNIHGFASILYNIRPKKVLK